jgi:hypothetical protein
MPKRSFSEAEMELGRRIAAAYISYIGGYKGVDRTLKQLADRPVGDLWLDFAAAIMNAHTNVAPRGSIQ